LFPPSVLKSLEHLGWSDNCREGEGVGAKLFMMMMMMQMVVIWLEM